MSNDKSRERAGRYERIFNQLEELFKPELDIQARMATAAALLHHKMTHFFWTGFYKYSKGDLIVGPYQGPLACAVLRPAGTGVCWAGFNRNETIKVDDVHSFEGHIACDSRSRSEVVVPLRNSRGEATGVLDVDSDGIAAFTDDDVVGLERIVALIGAAD